MPLTILSDIQPSDGGNEFLCLSCRSMSRRSGRLSEDEVWCSANEYLPQSGYGTRIPFVVTRCTEFRRKDPSHPTSRDLEAMQGLATFIVPSKEGHGAALVNYTEFKRREREGEI